MFLFNLYVLCWTLYLSVNHAEALWPITRSLSTGSDALVLSPGFQIHSELSQTPTDLLEAIAQTKTFLFTDRLQRLIVGRGATDSSAIEKAKTLDKLNLVLAPGVAVRSIPDEITRPLEERSEEYSLSIPTDGSIAVIKANSTLGLYRGLTTFQQFWYTYKSIIYMLEAPVSIFDQPAYAYRGFGLDTARNFFPVDDIKRTLDAMSWVKLSVLYWHVVDSQSFPLEVAVFPELSQAGAYSENSIYSEEDVQGIISYAAAHGIDVVLELDTPGHETAIGAAYPEHIACNQATPWATYASEPPAGQLRLATPSTVNFTVELVSSVSKAFLSPLFSTGGDEVNTVCYDDDLQTQEDLEASGLSFDQALDAFLHKLQAVIRAEGKTPIVKQDMILNHNTTLPNDTIAIVWVSSDDAKSIAQRGYRFIHQPSNYFYLDCGGGGWVGEDVLGNSWCDPFKTWQRSYSFDPLANLTAEESKLVLGGQTPLWTEQSGPQNLDPVVWPRAATTAEVFWTGATLPDGTPRNVSSALQRLHDIRYRMVQRGVNAIHLQPEWCALRPHACDLDA